MNSLVCFHFTSRGRREQRREVGADGVLALEALAPEIRALGVPELAVLGEGIDDAVDVAAREGVGDLVQALQGDVGKGGRSVHVRSPLYSTLIGTPGVCLGVRNTIIDFTWLTLGAEVRRVVRNF